MMAVWEEAFGGETDWILKVVLGLSQAREGSHWGPGTVPSKGAGLGPVHATSRAPYLQPPRQTEALLATARHLQLQPWRGTRLVLGCLEQHWTGGASFPTRRGSRFHRLTERDPHSLTAADSRSMTSLDRDELSAKIAKVSLNP